MATFQTPAVEADGRTATLVHLEGRDACIRLDGALVPARVALSCLLQPEPGDTVLAMSAADTLWVLAVLDRHAPAALRLAAAGDLAIASGGTLTVQAADALVVQAPAARTAIGDVVHAGQRLTVHLSSLRVIADLVETLAERVLLRARRSTRFVTDTDQTRAGAIDHRADGPLHLHGDTAFVTGKALVRVDAAQIHMG